MSYVVVSDSSCDLTVEDIKKYGIHIVSYYVSFGGDDYYKEYVDLTAEDFYRKLQDKTVFPKTSMPPLSDYCDVFEKQLELGKDILCICLTSKFSGSYSSAHMAKKELSGKYPDREIRIIDSTQASFMQGLLVIEAAKMKQEGFTLDENAKVLDLLKKEEYLAITVDSLTFLQRGGRIGKAGALAGELLSIKPIITLSQGELIPHSKIRTRKKAIDKIIEILKEYSLFDTEQYHFVILHSESEEDAKMLAQRMKQEYGVGIAHPPMVVGSTIGTHIGPTVIGLGCIKKRNYILDHLN